jgi:hypothetical protein
MYSCWRKSSLSRTAFSRWKRLWSSWRTKVCCNLNDHMKIYCRGGQLYLLQEQDFVRQQLATAIYSTLKFIKSKYQLILTDEHLTPYWPAGRMCLPDHFLWPANIHFKFLTFNFLNFQITVAVYFFILFRVVFWDILPCKIIVTVNHTRRRENLKSHILFYFLPRGKIIILNYI